MADTFRRNLDARCAVGGCKCSCCNDYTNDKEVLRRTVRRTMKQKDKQIIKEELDTDQQYGKIVLNQRGNKSCVKKHTTTRRNDHDIR